MYGSFGLQPHGPNYVELLGINDFYYYFVVFLNPRNPQIFRIASTDAGILTILQITGTITEIRFFLKVVIENQRS